MRVLATPEICLQSQAIPVYKYTKIQGPRFQRNYIISTVSGKNAWHNDPLLCPKYDEKRVADCVAEKCLCVRGLIELQSGDRVK